MIPLMTHEDSEGELICIWTQWAYLVIKRYIQDKHMESVPDSKIHKANYPRATDKQQYAHKFSNIKFGIIVDMEFSASS